jgi:hypothetical protein
MFGKLDDKIMKNNNNWTKIESEKDLPKLTIRYYIFKNSSLCKGLYVGGDRWIVEGNDYPKTTELHGITHFQKIEIPEPPIF